jgi:hypothetical protein
VEIIDDIRGGDRFYIREKLSNGQTLHLEMSMYTWTDSTIHWNIALSVFSKRKHAAANEAAVRMTGKAPMETVVKGLKAFKMLEAKVLESYSHYNNIIFCTWIDTRRRDAYYKILSRYGYNWGQIDGFKCIMKVFERRNDDEGMLE